VFAGFRRNWRELKKARPGERFQQRYQRNRGQSGNKPFWRILQVIAGVLLALAGIIFCFIPGPGLPLIFMGAGLLANHSLLIARAMDWLELKIRRIVHWAKAWWLHASTLARYAVVVIAAALAGGTGYGAYQVVFGR
jgi:hypothetical protein